MRPSPLVGIVGLLLLAACTPAPKTCWIEAEQGWTPLRSQEGLDAFFADASWEEVNTALPIDTAGTCTSHAECIDAHLAIARAVWGRMGFSGEELDLLAAQARTTLDPATILCAEEPPQ